MLANRTPREKILLLVMVLAVLAFGTFRFIWQPMAATRTTLTQDIAALQDITLLARAHKAAPQQRSTPRAVQPISVVATQTSAAYELNLRRVQTEGDGVRLSLSDAPFDAVVLWLEELSNIHRITVQAVEISRRPAPGVVNVNLLLKAL